MDDLKKSNSESGTRETSRLEAFSDGVFAIAITLLILELIEILHTQSDKGLLKLLLYHWQSFAAFGIGFLTILICWINHHVAFEYIKKIDNNLFWVNGFVLLVVTFTPFPTAILAEYFEKEPKTALALFGINYFMMSLAAYCICVYPYKKHLIEEDSRDLFAGLTLLYKYSIIYTFLIFFVCLLSVPLAIFFYCVLFVVFAYPKKSAKIIVRRKHKRKIRK